jgi:[protein-PII] uridylyltransferase
MTAPDNLSAWKDGLLRDLMLRAREHFRGARPGARPAAASGADEARARVRQLVAAHEHPELARIVEGIDPRLFTQLTPRQAARHARLAAAALGAEPPVAIEVHCWPLKGHSEVAIVAPDAPGVLAAIAGALTASRLDVLGAVLGHVELAGSPARRLALDVFYVRDLRRAAIPEDDARWPRLADDLRGLLAGPPEPARVSALIARRRPRSTMPQRVTPGVVTEIKLHDDSTQATIVEVATRDRVGVLHAITQTLADAGLDISLAKVATEGEKVADVFYVTRGGARLTDEAERAALLARLHEAVESPGLAGA